MKSLALILKRGIVTVLACAALLVASSPLAYAATPHEDPDVAKLIYSSLSLLRYYSESLDFVLMKNAAETEIRLGKMPFANIPEELDEPTANFSTHGISVSYLIVSIYSDLGDLRQFSEQGRLDKAITVYAGISLNLTRAYTEVEKLEAAAEATGKEIQVENAPPDSQLSKTYNEVLEKIRLIKDMLDLYRNLLSGSRTVFPEETQMLLRPTAITLNINTEAAFVGDDIRFDGVLTNEGEPLAGKQVNIILNGSPYVTAITGANGHFNGTLVIPYWYIPEMELQALYSPRDKEASIYLSSISPVIKLGILFYEAKLEISMSGKAYPGLETTITGKFDYGNNPPLSERSTEIYLDGVFITEDKQPESFTKKMQLSPKIEVGEHNITASAAADKRYAPVFAEMILPVTLSVPVLEINVPGLAVIPGSLDINGRLTSEVSPVSGASVKMTLAGSQNDFVCSENGSFNNELKMGMGLSIIGSQELTITVIPKEPWLATLVATRRLVIINLINCGGILALLILLGVYLPGKLRRKLEIQPGQAAAVKRPAILPEPVLTVTETTNAPVKAAETGESYTEPRQRILNWYRLALKLIQRITNSLLKPQQTLREFADETGRLLGPIAKYFFEFTRMVERLLYSPYVATTGDVQTVRNLSSQIVAESGTNNNVQSVASQTRDATKTGISAVSDEIPMPDARVVAASTNHGLRVDNKKQLSISPTIAAKETGYITVSDETPLPNVRDSAASDSNVQSPVSPTRDTTKIGNSTVSDKIPLPDARIIAVSNSQELRTDNKKRLFTWLLALLILAVIDFAFLTIMVAVRMASR